MKISIVGTGYVGLSLAVLISRVHEVVAVDIVTEKVEMINAGRSPIADEEIQQFLQSNTLKLKATINLNEVEGSKYIIVATPTNYDAEKHHFNTDSVENVIKQLEVICPTAIIVIKSTVPIGFTEAFCKENYLGNVLFSPEFLREGKALHDNLHPTRIIVGVPDSSDITDDAECFANILAECSEERSVQKLIIKSTEAESIKLFSNTYLAMRIAFFNELDTFAESNGLDTKAIITGVCMDPRIGNWYNNPSFGYGGYCLPKDTKQLLSNYNDIPNSLINAIVDSNRVRKSFIAKQIIEKAGKGKVVGIYRLIMKTESDNFRESSVIDIMNELKSNDVKVIIYEPIVSDSYLGFPIINNIDEFTSLSDIIIANRMSEDIKKFKEKLYCRDIYERD